MCDGAPNVGLNNDLYYNFGGFLIINNYRKMGSKTLVNKAPILLKPPSPEALANPKAAKHELWV